MSNPVPSIPTSPALSEAEPDSLQELFSRDPERLSEQSFEAIIHHMRQLRERIEAADSSGQKVRQDRIKVPTSPQHTTKDLADLGL